MPIHRTISGAMIRRGEIWVSRLHPNQGADVGKVGPMVVIQVDPLSEAGVATVLVVSLTTQQRRGAEAPRPRSHANR
ncbi:type II toxin-antitoxin system PemK/MazF family toxin [Synechococcus sp. CS-603]|nr:type II toxin-antitoxin system PemK/MazF family toxin [Synechococcus sp. CS-603]